MDEQATPQFVASSRRTAHRTGEDGTPVCGTQQTSKWARVDASSEAEAVLRYDLIPCTRCIDDHYDLGLRRKKRHGPQVIRSLDDKTYPFEEGE